MNLKRVMTGLTNRSVNGGLVAGLLAGEGLAGEEVNTARADGAADIGEIAWAACRAFRSRADWETTTTNAADWRDLDRAHFLPEDPYSQEYLEFLLMRAMIAAACAGRHVTAYQRMEITVKIAAMDLSADEKMFLVNEISTPVSVETLLDYAQGPELTTLVYTASVIAADATDSSGWQYLTSLAAALDLPEDLVEDIHFRVDGLLWGQFT